MDYTTHREIIQQSLFSLKTTYGFDALEIQPDRIICGNRRVELEIEAERYDAIGHLTIVDKQTSPPTRYTFVYVCDVIGVDFSKYPPASPPGGRSRELSMRLSRLVTIIHDNLSDIFHGDFHRLTSNNQYVEYVEAVKTIGLKVAELPYGDPILLKMQQGDKTWIDDYNRRMSGE